jgi:hypothetical protein
VFDRNRIIELFETLSAELVERGVRGEVFLVGGAAMAVAYDARRATRDVDAVFEPKTVVYDAARAVGERLALGDGWLNDAVKAFLPGDDAARRPVFEGAGLQVAVASPRYLLAMKLLAARPEQDADDIRLLMDLCGLVSADEGLAVIEQAYAEWFIPARVRFMLEEMYPET